MKEMKFERNHHTIKDMATGKRKPYPSVNAAKRESFKQQMDLDNALGRGSVRVVE